MVYACLRVTISMHIVYWAHSYRDEDAAVNRHLGALIEKIGLALRTRKRQTSSIPLLSVHIQPKITRRYFNCP